MRQLKRLRNLTQARLATTREDLHKNRDGAWRSLVAHLVWDQRVASSNLAAPTI